jgi:hypothetical protein
MKTHTRSAAERIFTPHTWEEENQDCISTYNYEHPEMPPPSKIHIQRLPIYHSRRPKRGFTPKVGSNNYKIADFTIEESTEEFALPPLDLSIMHSNGAPTYRIIKPKVEEPEETKETENEDLHSRLMDISHIATPRIISEENAQSADSSFPQIESNNKKTPIKISVPKIKSPRTPRKRKKKKKKKSKEIPSTPLEQPMVSSSPKNESKEEESDSPITSPRTKPSSIMTSPKNAYTSSTFLTEGDGEDFSPFDTDAPNDFSDVQRAALQEQVELPTSSDLMMIRNPSKAKLLPSGSRAQLTNGKLISALNIQQIQTQQKPSIISPKANMSPKVFGSVRGLHNTSSSSLSVPTPNSVGSPMNNDIDNILKHGKAKRNSEAGLSKHGHSPLPIIKPKKLITCKLGSKKCQVPFTVSDVDLQAALDFDNTSLLYVLIRGIRQISKKKRKKKIMPFVQDPTLTYVRRLQAEDMSTLKTHREYEVVVLDLRKVKVDELPEDDVSAIRKKFDKIDTDKNGELSEIEVRDFYHSQLNAKLQIFDRLREGKLSFAQSQEEKDEIHEWYWSHRDYFTRFYDSKIEIMMRSDTNKDGSVSWQEFLVSESMEVLRAKKYDVGQIVKYRYSIDASMYM